MAEPLVLLPGALTDGRLFSQAFLTLNADRAVMIAPLTGASSVGALAQSVLDSAPRRFALAGHGLGGMVAMEMLARAPDRVSRIALIATSPLPETPNEAAAREARIVGAQAGRLDEVAREEIPPASLAPGPGRVATLQIALDMARTLGPDVFVAQSRALQRRPDQQKTLRACRVPALILCGAHDTLFPLKRHETMSELLHGAHLHVVENAGHLPTLEAPEETTEALQTWLGAPFVLR